MATFPVSKPFPPNTSAADFVKRIREVGWAPCNADQLFGYAQAQFARILPTGKAKSAIGLRRAKGQAVDEWFAAMGLPASLVADGDFTEYADGDRWISGLGLRSSDDDYFGIIAIGAFDLRSDGSFEMTAVTRQAMVERWDSRIGGPTAQRLLFNTDPLEVVVAVFTDDGSLLVAGFHPRVFRLNARTLGDACELTAIIAQNSCLHGPHESDADADEVAYDEPDEDDGEDADDEDDEDEESAVRVMQLRGTPHGTIAHNCCGEWVLLPNDGRGASRLMSLTGKVCFPPDEAFTRTEWCVTSDPQGHTTVHHLPHGDVCATFKVNGGTVVSAVMPDERTIVTLSGGGQLQWFTLPVTRQNRGPITLSAHLEVPAGATFMALLEATGDAPPYLLVHTRHRRLTLLDPVSGAIRGDISRAKGIDRAMRAGPNHVVLWDSPEDPSGYQLNPLQCTWSDGIGMSEAQEAAGMLPDGRMVRAAFGVIVEDPRTGDTLVDYRPD